MVKIQVNSQGKAYFTSGNKVLVASSGADVVTATNNTGSTINSGDKVWINSGNSLVKYYKDEKLFMYQMVKNGNLSIDNNTGVASNFSTSNYISFENNVPYFSSMDMVLGFNTGTSPGAENMLMATQYRTFFINGDGRLGTYDSSVTTYGNTIISDDKDYLVRVIYDGTYFKYYLIEDTGYTIDTLPDISQWSLEYTITSNIFSGYSLLVGAYPTWNFYYHSTINLAKSYIKLDGKIWWIGAVSKTNINENTLTGVANETIANGSSGVVNTVLGE